MFAVAIADRKPGAIVEVARRGDLTLCSYGMTGTGWAVFKDKPGADPPYTCIRNGSLKSCLEVWENGVQAST